MTAEDRLLRDVQRSLRSVQAHGCEQPDALMEMPGQLRLGRAVSLKDSPGKADPPGGNVLRRRLIRQRRAIPAFPQAGSPAESTPAVHFLLAVAASGRAGGLGRVMPSFFHPEAKRVRVQAQHIGRVAEAVHAPAAALQHAADVIALDLVETPQWRRGGGGSGGRCRAAGQILHVERRIPSTG